MEWMLLPYKRYAQLGGRSRRKEYWMFILFTVLVQVVLDAVLGGSYSVLAGVRPSPSLLASIVTGLFGLFNFIPSLTVLARRLHDTDRSAWWMLIVLVPIVGALVLLYFLVSDGTPGPNRYGDDPKGRGLYGVFN